MNRDGGRADIHSGAVNPVPESGPDRDDPLFVADRHRYLPLALPQCGLQGPQHADVPFQPGQSPVLFQGLQQTLQVTFRAVQVRLRYFRKIQVHYRVQFDVVCFEVLAHHLVVHLAAGWYINSHIAEDFRLAAQAIARLQPPALPAMLLILAHVTQVVRAGNNPLPGETALHCLHLAAPATGPAATNGIDVHAQMTCCVQYRRADGEAPAFP